MKEQTPTKSTGVPTSEDVHLVVPITVNGVTVSKITLRRPKVSDRKAASTIADDDERVLFMLSRLTNLMPEDFEDMDLADFNAVGEKIESFLKARSKPSTK